MKKTKISIIGPVYPYRGGIAQYTEALTKALSKKAEVYPVSFKRLYPKSLYPGKSDKVAPLEKSKKENVDYILDATSLKSWNQAIKKIADRKCDVAIITWWTFVWQPALGYIAWRLKKKGIKVIYLCHNVMDHEENWLKKQVSRKGISIADGYIVHSGEEAKQIKLFKPSAKIMRRPHPIFTHFPKPSGKLKKRGKLELLYFGLIRPYKGVDVLIDAIKKLNDPEVHLTIVGEVWGDKNKEKLTNQLKQYGQDNIEHNFEYVDEKEAAEYFDRADVVVLPYLSATGSGVVTLAYYYGKPVLATAVGGLPDVVSNGETGRLVRPGNAVELAKTIARIDRNQVKKMQPNIKKFCSENTWDNMASEIYDFISGLDKR